ncbi:hypothetical protein [Thermococcus sp.]|uniref:hypothetical protein n=1 Tax=Thermococcus sp. TaxID=35749 RepID=UPI00263464B2|nr:hypothetical protein [Thermococcus sp.]
MELLAVLPRGPFSWGVKRTLNDLVSKVEVSDNAIVLPQGVEAQFGVFRSVSSVLLGSKVQTGGPGGSPVYLSGWLFNTSREFSPDQRVVSGELPLRSSPYRVEISPSGAGLIELPGYRVRNGVVILYITPEYRFHFPREVLNAGDFENYAQLSLKPLENGFHGTIDMNLRRGYAEVIVGGRVVEDQVFLDEKSGDFTYRFIENPLLVISHEKTLSPQGLQKALKGFIGLSGHGDFTMRLKVGKHKDEMTFSVGLGEE